MDLVRVGEKVICRRKINQIIEDILDFRVKGLSQAEVAARMGTDRTFISRLESLGEVRKGKRIAVVGFPVLNKEEINDLLVKEGVEFIFLMSEDERWEFVREKSGLDLLNSIMDLIALAHSFDQVVILGSNKRIKIIAAVLDKEIVGFEIGESPIKEDKYVNPVEFLEVIQAIKG